MKLICRRLLTYGWWIRHLNGTVLESFVRPAVLITDAYNALNNQPSRRQRDHEFLGISIWIFFSAAIKKYLIPI